MNDLHDLVAPYALDALEPLERTRFEAHLETCDVCLDELSGYAATAARLGASYERPAPTELRDRILAEAAATPQERPIITRNVGRLRRTLPRLAVAAALGLGVAGVGGYVIEHDRAVDSQAQADEMSAILAASDVESAEQRFDNGGVVRMMMSAEQDAAVIVARDLPDPGEGKVYQVWMITGDHTASHGTVTTAGTMLMHDVTAADSVAITVEPDGGSERPTGAPVVDIPV